MNKNGWAAILAVLAILIVVAGGSAAGTTQAEGQTRFDYWQVAKVKLVTDQSGSRFVNSQTCGQVGYVFGLNGETTPPYEVVGYKFLKSEDMGGGVTVYWYVADPEYGSTTNILENTVKCLSGK